MPLARRTDGVSSGSETPAQQAVDHDSSGRERKQGSFGTGGRAPFASWTTYAWPSSSRQAPGRRAAGELLDATAPAASSRPKDASGVGEVDSVLLRETIAFICMWPLGVGRCTR